MAQTTLVEEGEEPVASHACTQSDGTDGVLSGASEGGVEGVEGVEEGEGSGEEGESVASDDSFHSTVEMIELGVGGVVSGGNELYLAAMELVVRGGVQCRNIRYGERRMYF